MEGMVLGLASLETNDLAGQRKDGGSPGRCRNHRPALQLLDFPPGPLGTANGVAAPTPVGPSKQGPTVPWSSANRQYRHVTLGLGPSHGWTWQIDIVLIPKKACWPLTDY
jgi:hypothetical protein